LHAYIDNELPGQRGVLGRSRRIPTMPRGYNARDGGSAARALRLVADEPVPKARDRTAARAAWWMYGAMAATLAFIAGGRRLAGAWRRGAPAFRVSRARWSRLAYVVEV
jgi:hypothetical protein